MIEGVMRVLDTVGQHMTQHYAPLPSTPCVVQTRLPSPCLAPGCGNQSAFVRCLAWDAGVAIVRGTDESDEGECIIVRWFYSRLYCAQNCLSLDLTVDELTSKLKDFPALIFLSQALCTPPCRLKRRRIAPPFTHVTITNVLLLHPPKSILVADIKGDPLVGYVCAGKEKTERMAEVFVVRGHKDVGLIHLAWQPVHSVIRSESQLQPKQRSRWHPAPQWRRWVASGKQVALSKTRVPRAGGGARDGMLLPPWQVSRD